MNQPTRNALLTYFPVKCHGHVDALDFYSTKHVVKGVPDHLGKEFEGLDHNTPLNVFVDDAIAMCKQVFRLTFMFHLENN